MRQSFACPWMFLLLLSSLSLRAQESRPAAPGSAARSPWTVEDVVMQESARGWRLSRDGRQLLWLKFKPDPKQDRAVATLMLTDLPAGTHRALSVGRSRLSAPRFSPSGRYVSFLSNRKFPEGMKAPKKGRRGVQIWLLDLRGGEARPLTRVAFGVRSYQWLDDDTLFLTARDGLSREESLEKKHKDATVAVEDRPRFLKRIWRLFRLDRKSLKLKRVTRNQEPMGSFSLSPDGRFVAARLNQSPSFTAQGDIPPRIMLYDLKQGSARELFATRRSKPSRMVWRHDSKGLFCLYPKSTVDGEVYGAVTLLKEVRLPEWIIGSVDLRAPAGIGGSFQVTADGFVVRLCHGLWPSLARFVRDSKGRYQRQDLKGAALQHVWSLVTAWDSKRVVFLKGSAQDPDHVLTGRLDGARILDQKEIYRPNGGFPGKPLARVQPLTWKGAEGDTIEGLLYYPHDYQPGQRRPLVLITHGGPHGADHDRFGERWANSPNLYCQRGAFVLKTNYHGSSDYGLAFGESIKGRYYELELQDLFAGIQKLVDDGLVDPEKLGLVGWSNGAILSLAALTLGKRFAPRYDFHFRACAPGAGDVNWTSDYGNCAFGAAFDDFYLGGPPWEKPKTYLLKSPLFEVARVTTPTILFFGTKDTNVPTEQGWEWFRGMRRAHRAPVRFLLFPGEPHGFSKLSSKRRKLTEELAWFDHYLFGKPLGKVRLVKRGSPLDVAQKARNFARHKGMFGVRQGGVLVPETIPFGKLEVGRFEVTRAQWAAFLGGQAPPLPLANVPETGITPKQARGYVVWLRQRTGEPWRLLRERDWQRLAKAAGSRPNTLDTWAGYHPTLEEALLLKQKLMALPRSLLLLPVGSRPPGEVRGRGARHVVFDVGGNVAEWVLQADGSLRAEGGWALASQDPRGGPKTPPAAWTGLRLGKGPGG